MEQRVYRGSIDSNMLAQHLLDTWNQGETMAQALEDDQGVVVQIGYRSGGFFNSEPQNALTLALEPVADGVRVSLGEQQWYREQGGQIMVGGLIGFFPFFFTWPLGGGRDEPVDPQLAQQVWASVEQYTQQTGGSQDSTQQLPRRPQAITTETTRLQGVTCPSCGVENMAGAERCQECGTFLGVRDCPQCGVSNPGTANFCMRCGSPMDTRTGNREAETLPDA